MYIYLTGERRTCNQLFFVYLWYELYVRERPCIIKSQGQTVFHRLEGTTKAVTHLLLTKRTDTAFWFLKDVLLVSPVVLQKEFRFCSLKKKIKAMLSLSGLYKPLLADTSSLWFGLFIVHSTAAFSSCKQELISRSTRRMHVVQGCNLTKVKGQKKWWNGNEWCERQMVIEQHVLWRMELWAFQGFQAKPSDNFVYLYGVFMNKEEQRVSTSISLYMWSLIISTV